MRKKEVGNKKLEILMLTDGNFDQASARIRAIQYIPMLETTGYLVKFLPRVPIKANNWLGKYLLFPIKKRLLLFERFITLNLFHWDVIFVQRLFIDNFSLKRIKGKCKLIFDFDDAIYLNGKKEDSLIKARTMVGFADQVIVSSPFLKDFCESCGKQAVIIPTPVETEQILPTIKENNEPPVIGWIGSSWTTFYLKSIESSLKTLAEQTDFKLITVGAKSDFMPVGVNHINYKWELGIELKILKQIDIGIMPLTDDEYATAKGGYKLCLYMAAGIPCVASSVGINKEIIHDGVNGFLVASEQDWLKSLKTLLSNSNLRHNLGKNGREKAVELYDRKICYSQLLQIIKD